MQGRGLRKAECTQWHQMLLRGQLGTESFSWFYSKTHWRHRMRSSGGKVGAAARSLWTKDSAGGEEMEVINNGFDFNRLG